MEKTKEKFKSKNFLFGIAAGFAVVFLVSVMLTAPPVVGPAPPEPGNYTPSGEKTDDWVYLGPSWESEGLLGGVQKMGAPNVAYSGGMAMAAEDSIGFSVGGAKDINNFRNNIENDYLPVPSDVTYEGLFYGYYFDTGQASSCNKLFCPPYTYAISKDPFSEDDEYYLSVGLTSNMKESDFERKKLNLVVVLDISGSMSSPFNRYYYDQFGNEQTREGDDDDWSKSKMQVANEAIVALMDHLEDDDRFGVVLFDSSSYLAKPLTYVGNTDMNRVADHILEITPQGGTYMEAGIKQGTELFRELIAVDKTEYENRIIFLTDAMPNIGDTSEDGLLGMTKKNADDGIYLTFIGIGVDFNTELTEAITKIRGANYYSVHSNSEFKERMDEDFAYMVTPLVFDLELKLDARGYEIMNVYGSPEANEATGELMKVNTLFPSKTEGGETKGGIVLLKLRKFSEDAGLTLSASYEDREGKPDNDSQDIRFGDESAEYFENSGIRKAIVLARYADLVINWMADEHDAYDKHTPVKPSVTRDMGIICPPGPDYYLGRWERQSVPLSVSSEYRELFADFAGYFESEMNALGDETMSLELDLLEKLSTYL
jgi:Ca-activated chloride channel homolog